MLGAAPFSDAKAADLIYTDTVAPTSTDLDVSLLFPEVNPSLYTLTGVTVTLSGDWASQASETNSSGSRSHLFIDLTSSMSLTGPSNTALASLGPEEYVFSAYVPAKVGTHPGTYSGSQGVSDQTTVNLAPSLFALFIGTGNIATDLATLTGVTESVTGGNNSVSLATQAGATVTVDYQVSAVPLPGGLALFATGLVSLGFIGWTRGRKNNA